VSPFDVERNLDRYLAEARAAARRLAPGEPLRPGSGLTARAAVELFDAGASAFSGRRGGPESVVAAVARGAQAWFATLLSRPEEGLELATDAVADLRSASDPSALALALQSLCLSSMYSGLMEDLLAAAEEAVAVTTEAGDPWAEAVAQTWVAYAYLFTGRPDEGLRAASRARAALTRIGEHWSHTFALTSLASIAASAGRFSEVLEYYRDSASLCREIGSSAVCNGP